MNEPLFLSSVFHEKIWGGDRLNQLFGYDIPSNHTGECWAISAHPNGVSTVINGPFSGVRLDDLYKEHPSLFGNPKEPVFPLLTKIIDANDWLSIQVHPDDLYGLKHEGELGKTECWYILAADEDAEIIYGHQARSRQELIKRIAQQDWDSLFKCVKVNAGDFFYVPSGTMHAIGKGVLILETQQSSDTTYRVYDFDRKDNKGNLRELHIQQSIDVMTIGEIEETMPTIEYRENCMLTTFVKNDFFTVYKWSINGEASFKKIAPYTLVSVIDGQGELKVAQQVYPLKKGQHFILPNGLEDWLITGKIELIASH